LRQLFSKTAASIPGGLTRETLDAAAELSRHAVANGAPSALQRLEHLRRLE
jgi:hypothetical protein